MNILSRHSQTVFSLTVIALSILFSATASATAVQRSQERRINFNDGWLFLNARADGAEKPDFDDSQWKEVRLPHDWAIEGPFDPKANPHTGALPNSGTGWYQKSFTVSNDLKDRIFTIEFDGAMSTAHLDALS